MPKCPACGSMRTTSDYDPDQGHFYTCSCGNEWSYKGGESYERAVRAIVEESDEQEEQ